jgi:hypothetical protein
MNKKIIKYLADRLQDPERFVVRVKKTGIAFVKFFIRLDWPFFFWPEAGLKPEH